MRVSLTGVPPASLLLLLLKEMEETKNTGKMPVRLMAKMAMLRIGRFHGDLQDERRTVPRFALEREFSAQQGGQFLGDG